MQHEKTGLDGLSSTLPSKTVKVKTGYGNLYITITEEGGQPKDVFVTIGKSGQSIMAKAELAGRLTSLALRYGVPLKEIVHQLKGIGGQNPLPTPDGLILSIPDAVGRTLEKLYLKETSSNGLERKS